MKIVCKPKIKDTPRVNPFPLPIQKNNIFIITDPRGAQDSLENIFAHKVKSNNWLKRHGKPKRRKPFKRIFFTYKDL